MSFGTRAPRAPQAANAPIEAQAPEETAGGLANPAASLISTSPEGLRRRANTQRTSLIGG